MIEKYSSEVIKKSVYTTLRYCTNIATHSHYFWEFTYCTTGELIHKINGEPIKMHTLSEIILIKPNDTHEIIQPATEINSATKHYRDIYVTPEKMKKCCDFLDPKLYETLLNTPVIILDGKNENLESLEQSLSIFQRYYGYVQENAEFLEKLHTALIFQILGIYLRNNISKKKKYPDWIDNFLEQTKNESFLCGKVEDIIKSYNYSHSYVCREFKKYLGKTMVQFLNESRVIYSTVLLLDPKISILDIAMRLNYSSQSAYINAFKKVYKIPPNQWRNKQLKL